MDLSLIDTLKRNAPLSDSQIVKLEIKEFIESERYKNMLAGARYYAGKHDILDTKRMAIGKDGLLTEVKNVANNKIVHTFATELIDQKIQYLLVVSLALRVWTKQKMIFYKVSLILRSAVK